MRIISKQQCNKPTSYFKLFTTDILDTFRIYYKIDAFSCSAVIIYIDPITAKV